MLTYNILWHTALSALEWRYHCHVNMSGGGVTHSFQYNLTSLEQHVGLIRETWTSALSCLTSAVLNMWLFGKLLKRLKDSGTSAERRSSLRSPQTDSGWAWQRSETAASSSLWTAPCRSAHLSPEGTEAGKHGQAALTLTAAEKQTTRVLFLGEGVTLTESCSFPRLMYSTAASKVLRQ